jgi:hypothetical protein
MNRRHLIRGLRIAWSVWWGILCVLLVVLWVRSYAGVNSISWYRGREAILFGSRDGRIFLFPFTVPAAHVISWEVNCGPVDPEMDLLISWRSNSRYYQRSAPHWRLIAISAITAVLPWLRWKFSLRTLLFATTLIAAILGLIVYAIRS